MHQARGLCLYQDANRLYYFVTNSAGEVRQFMIRSDKQWSAEQVRHFKLDSNAEGCVVDDYYRTLYIAEDSSGIWKYDAQPDGDLIEKVISLSWLGPLRADLEGMTIYDSGDGKGYLMVSSQGNSRYAIFDRVSNKQLETFRIEANGEVDGTSKSDGIDVSSINYGPRFPSGFFIAHDDTNESPEGTPQSQNFKVVDWRLIQKQIDKIAGK
jgi:3-phytase